MTALHLAEKFIHLDTWAVVGASENPEKYGHIITSRLLKAGKKVFPINPKEGSIGGVIFYPSLSALPALPQIVNLVVPPDVARKIVEECGNLGITRIWFQPGTRFPEAKARCRELGIEAVDDSCVLVMLGRLN